MLGVLMYLLNFYPIIAHGIAPGCGASPTRHESTQIKAVTSCSTHKIDQQETDG